MFVSQYLQIRICAETPRRCATIVHQTHMNAWAVFLFAPFVGLTVLGTANVGWCAATQDGPPVDDTGNSVSSLAIATYVPLSVTAITSPIEPDSTARIDAQTGEGADCMLLSDSPSADETGSFNLGSKVADATGFVSWSWYVGNDAAPGVQQLRLTCNGETVSAQVEISGPTPVDSGGAASD